MSSNEYMASYMNQRYKKRRSEAVSQLGGHCAHCGRIDEGHHQFDHVDPATKLAAISDLWSASEILFQTELSKCQLLCPECHVEKTLAEKGQVRAVDTHGTLSSYRYCRCDLCKAAKSAWSKQKRLEKT